MLRAMCRFVACYCRTRLGRLCGGLRLCWSMFGLALVWTRLPLGWAVLGLGWSWVGLGRTEAGLGRTEAGLG